MAAMTVNNFAKTQTEATLAHVTKVSNSAKTRKLANVGIGE